MSTECTRCGACCVAPDIAALGKPLGERCPHLTAENLCAVYESRPQICRDYQADWLCDRIAAPTLDERVRKYLAVFDLAPAAGGASAPRVPIVQFVQLGRPTPGAPASAAAVPHPAR
jgi:hypothetical protein